MTHPANHPAAILIVFDDLRAYPMAVRQLLAHLPAVSPDDPSYRVHVAHGPAASALIDTWDEVDHASD